MALAAFFVIGAAVVWFGMRPTFVRATAEQIVANGLDSSFTPSRMPRSELAYIFRGRALVGRYKTWQPAYFLVTHDDTPKIGLLGEAFRDEGMVAFAEKLGVPVKGDFTAQVR